MIEYFPRYSNTDLPDDMGRWVRTATYKNIRIAWISRLEVKDFVKERWEWFLNAVS